MYKYLVLLLSFNVMASPSYWNLKEHSSTNKSEQISEFDIQPSHFQLVEFNHQAMAHQLLVNKSTGNSIISLPLPSGDFEEFTIREVSIMAPNLAIKFPNIRTFRGQSIDSNKRLVMDITQKGFHAVIKSNIETVWIDPVSRDTNTTHMSYYQSDIQPRNTGFQCDVQDHDSIHDKSHNMSPESVQGGSLPINELELKTYSLAVAATAEYTTFHSSPNAANVADGMAAIVTAMNRVNGIYELEVGIRMVLVDNNDQLVFTDPATDGYSNNNGGAMLNQNISRINSIIGAANYDIGHVFSTGGGGVAFLGVPCRNTKAGGVTGLNSPVNDVFYVDYVAHEMGHQWGANHIFNATSGGCGGGNRTGSAAVEPGSGSTIMGYAGLCGALNNLQNFSNAYFNSHSLYQIINYSTNSNGANCSVISDTMNEAPVVEAGENYAIPHTTPFVLCAQATDDDDTNMTFNWEQNDIGPAGNHNTPSGNAPIFRSNTATTDNCRVFPKMSNVLNNLYTGRGERLPTYARNLNFRATVRDNELDGGAIGTDDMDIVVTADGPFELLSHNGPYIVTGVNNTFVWDVANTNMAPVNCATVDIDFSEDGGQTFANAVTGIPNTGNGVAMVPKYESNSIRVRIKCSDNIFFDINNSNLSHIDDSIYINGFESGK